MTCLTCMKSMRCLSGLVKKTPDKPAETEVREYARILERSTTEKADLWITRLSKLNKGECYAFGPSLNQMAGKLEEKAFRIKITAVGKRND